MATNDRSIESSYTLLSLNPENNNHPSPQSAAKKEKSWQSWFSWNTLFKGAAITLLVGGTIAVGFGIASALWPISIPLAIFVTAAATGTWLIASHKTIYNTMAKWGSSLDGNDKPLDKAETLLKDINKLNKRVNEELINLNEQEQKNAKFLRINQRLAKHDEQTAAQLAKLYLESAKQQNHKYRSFHKIVKQIKQIDPKLANKLHKLYSNDSSVRGQEALIKANHCYQLLARKDKHLARKIVKLYSDHQQQESQLNQRFCKLRTKINKQDPKLADQLSKIIQNPKFKNDDTPTLSTGYFKAHPCQIKRTWTHSLLKEIKTKQAMAHKLLKNSDVYDEVNQKRQKKCKDELALTIQTVNDFYPRLRTLANLYQDFKASLKEFTHPLKESINQFAKTIKSRSPFKRAASNQTIKRSVLNEQFKQAEAINGEEELSHAETLTNHGIFATTNELGQGHEKPTKNIPLAITPKIVVNG